MPTPESFTDIDNNPHICHVCKKPTIFSSMIWCWWEIDEQLKAVEVCDECVDDPNQSFFVVPDPDNISEDAMVVVLSER